MEKLDRETITAQCYLEELSFGSQGTETALSGRTLNEYLANFLLLPPSYVSNQTFLPTLALICYQIG